MQITVKVHNNDRMKKVERYTKDSRTRRNKPRAYYKDLTYYKIPQIMRKFGYGYQTENETLMEIQESFRTKCECYFNQNRVGKMGRMDKIKRKEEMDFEIKENPILSFFNKLNSKLVKPALSEALEKISITDFGKQYD